MKKLGFWVSLCQFEFRSSAAPISSVVDGVAIFLLEKKYNLYTLYVLMLGNLYNGGVEIHRVGFVL